MNDIICIIPSYCPGDRLTETIDSLSKQDIACVVVNDGSPREYDDVFEKVKEKCTLLSHAENRGKGAALKTAMAYIDDHYENKIIVCADGDGQHLVKDIENCARKAKEHEGTLVLGVRRFDRENVPFKSYYGNKITEAIFHLFTGVHVSDTQTGLRAFDQELMKKLRTVEGDRYEYEMKQLLYCVKEKIPFFEEEIETVYEGKNECSHFHPLRDSFVIYKQLLSFCLSSILSFFVDFSLFALLSQVFEELAFANVFARIGSGLFNFEVNRKAVFEDGSRPFTSFVRYALLAGSILLVNTLLLYVFVYKLRVNKIIAKLFVEAGLFLVSWYMQKNYVFVRKAA